MGSILSFKAIMRAAEIGAVMLERFRASPARLQCELSAPNASHTFPCYAVAMLSSERISASLCYVLLSPNQQKGISLRCGEEE